MLPRDVTEVRAFEKNPEVVPLDGMVVCVLMVVVVAPIEPIPVLTSIEMLRERWGRVADIAELTPELQPVETLRVGGGLGRWYPILLRAVRLQSLSSVLHRSQGSS